MNKNNYNVIGVMSGTSLDGIDLALINFNKKTNWSYKILSAETRSYPDSWKKVLEKAVDYDPSELNKLNKEYTSFLAGRVKDFMQKKKITQVDAVCSHGHTIKHEPENAFTLQIGNLPDLADSIGQKVVCDFRVQDVQMGGQGAPLVPIGDELLFSQYDYCLNLGGFANLSTRKDGVRIAYDICAVNTVLNELSGRLGLEYDKNGAMAASGKLDEKLLEQLNRLGYYQKDPPKSLGIEWVNRHVFPLVKDAADVPSALHTYVVHAAIQITREFNSSSAKNILVTGGGAFNRYLVEQMKARTTQEILLPSVEVINYKEALIFGFLGVLRLRGENNVLSSVTGAEKDHSSGVIFEPVRKRKPTLPSAQ